MSGGRLDSFHVRILSESVRIQGGVLTVFMCWRGACKGQGGSWGPPEYLVGLFRNLGWGPLRVSLEGLSKVVRI